LRPDDISCGQFVPEHVDVFVCTGMYLSEALLIIGANPLTALWGVHGNREVRRAKLQRPIGVAFLRKWCSPPHQLGD